MRESLAEYSGLTLSFNTTEDCNLACKYCYEINKKRKTLDIETAKKFIDIMVDDPDPIGLFDDNFPEPEFKEWLYDSVILDLIGGDALMRPELCDQILSYFIEKIWSSDTPKAIAWRTHWKCSISTNGTLFANPKVREFCKKWNENLSIGVSIDGCPELHDLNRPFVGGGGSMAEILKWRPWVKENLHFAYYHTKSTLARNSIPYIFESLKWMYNHGIIEILQNFIMEENFCTEADYKELIHQLEMSIDWILETPGVDSTLYWSMLDKHQFAEHHNSKDGGEWERSKCGSGNMPALAIDGNIYPCFRWLPHTTGREGAMCCGNVNDGLIHRDAFLKVANGGRRSVCTKDPKCQTCRYESACAYCIGGCYAEFGEFRRTTYICTIAKIQCEMAKRYWNRYNKKHNIDKRYKEYELPV